MPWGERIEDHQPSRGQKGEEEIAKEKRKKNDEKGDRRQALLQEHRSAQRTIFCREVK